MHTAADCGDTGAPQCTRASTDSAPVRTRSRQDVARIALKVPKHQLLHSKFELLGWKRGSPASASLEICMAVRGRWPCSGLLRRPNGFSVKPVRLAQHRSAKCGPAHQRIPTYMLLSVHLHNPTTQHNEPPREQIQTTGDATGYSRDANTMQRLPRSRSMLNASPES